MTTAEESDAKSDGIIAMLMSDQFTSIGNSPVQCCPVPDIDDGFTDTVTRIARDIPKQLTDGITIEILESLNKFPGWEGALGASYNGNTVSISKDLHVVNFTDSTLMASEIRQTILHEIAHLFGVTDEELQQRGLYSPGRA